MDGWRKNTSNRFFLGRFRGVESKSQWISITLPKPSHIVGEISTATTMEAPTCDKICEEKEDVESAYKERINALIRELQEPVGGGT